MKIGTRHGVRVGAGGVVCRGWGGKETWIFFDLPGKKVVLRLGFTSNHWKKGA